MFNISFFFALNLSHNSTSQSFPRGFNIVKILLSSPTTVLFRNYFIIRSIAITLILQGNSTAFRVQLQVQRCIYTTNWIERLNRKYKRTIKMRTSMPSNNSALFLLASVAMEETKTTYTRKIHQWKFWKNNKEKWRIS